MLQWSINDTRKLHISKPLTVEQWLEANVTWYELGEYWYKDDKRVEIIWWWDQFRKEYIIWKVTISDNPYTAL